MNLLWILYMFISCDNANTLYHLQQCCFSESVTRELPVNQDDWFGACSSYILSKQKHPRCKKKNSQVLKRPYWKRCKIKQAAMASCFDRFRSFGHDDLDANTAISVVQGFLMLSGNKIFDEDDQASNIKIATTKLFCGLVIFIRILIPWTSRGLECAWNNTVLQWDHHDQNFKTSGGLDCPFDFTFFQQGLFSTWPLLFTPGVFLFRFHFFSGIWNQWNGMLKWNDGMEWWNGITK